MNYRRRLCRAFRDAPCLPLNEHSRYLLISDCHRGNGSSNDNFLKNQHLYAAALEYYYRHGYTCIELGDGDELWENRSMQQIIEVHSHIFRILARFYHEGRFYSLYGNHDIVKKSPQAARWFAELLSLK